MIIFWGDEGWVPLNSKLSNAGAAFKDLLTKVSVPKDQIFDMYKEGVIPEEYAHTYASILEKHLLDARHVDLIFLEWGRMVIQHHYFPEKLYGKKQIKKLMHIF